MFRDKGEEDSFPRSHPRAAALVERFARELAEQLAVLLLFATARLHFFAR
jgi:hypothetical protein